jgi:hypothetical protein
MPRKPKPSVTNRVPVVPSSSGRGGKHLRIIVRLSDPVPQADQVMTQVELSPYHRPHSPLDLVAVEIIFGTYFKRFTECHRPQLLDPCLLLKISLFRRNVIGFHCIKHWH